MASFLFTIIPALGHINPTMPVAAELKKRGHTIGYATGADFENAATSENFSFFPIGPANLAKATSKAAMKTFKYTGMRSHINFYKLLAEVNLETIGPMLNIVKDFKPDVIVADSLTFTGGQMAEVYKLPWATYCSVPGLINTKDAPPFTSWGLPPAKNAFTKSFYSMLRIVHKNYFKSFDGMFNYNRSTLLLNPVKCCAIESCLSPYMILSPTCEGFEYKRYDWPEQMRLIGPAPWGKSFDGDNTFDWIDALPDNKPVIYVTLGTLQTFRRLNFFNVVMDALKDQPYNVVMSVGKEADLSVFKNVPSNFRIERFVPHSKILLRATAVVHHGGQGIAQDCIYHGLPSVVIPISQDLYEVARRCSVAGVSERIPYPKLRAKRLRVAVQKVLTDETILQCAKNLQSVYLKTNAAVTGADLLEKLAATGRPVLRGLSAGDDEESADAKAE